jgi:integrase
LNSSPFRITGGNSALSYESVIYDDNLEYQTFIKNYRTSKSRNGAFRYYASKYIDYIRNDVESSTISTYRSKLRLFDAWLESQNMSDADVSVITQPVMVEFMLFIIEERKLSKVSVDNYRILLSAVFDYVRKKNKLYANPCIELPLTKRINDSAAEPIQEMDIPIFKEVIQQKDPQLWLAICFEYYCFMRPRKEIRLLRIGDIDFARGLIRVRWENSKTTQRMVNIPEPFLRLMRDTYKLHDFPRHYFVFGKKGQPEAEHLSINNMSNRFMAIRQELGMPEGYKLYSWKHTGNIRADSAGIPRREIQMQNGHTSLQTTEVYMKKKKGVDSPNIVSRFPSL